MLKINYDCENKSVSRGGNYKTNITTLLRNLFSYLAAPSLASVAKIIKYLIFDDRHKANIGLILTKTYSISSLVSAAVH